MSWFCAPFKRNDIIYVFGHCLFVFLWSNWAWDMKFISDNFKMNLYLLLFFQVSWKSNKKQFRCARISDVEHVSTWLLVSVGHFPVRMLHLLFKNSKFLRNWLWFSLSLSQEMWSLEHWCHQPWRVPGSYRGSFWAELDGRAIHQIPGSRSVERRRDGEVWRFHERIRHEVSSANENAEKS